MDCSPPGSSVHGILQARKLEWAGISFYILYVQDVETGDLPNPGIEPKSLALAGDSFPLSHREAHT